MGSPLPHHRVPRRRRVGILVVVVGRSEGTIIFFLNQRGLHLKVERASFSLFIQKVDELLEHVKEPGSQVERASFLFSFKVDELLLLKPGGAFKRPGG